METGKSFLSPKALALALALCLSAGGAAAQIFVGQPKDASEPVVLSNFETDATPVLLVAAASPTPSAPKLAAPRAPAPAADATALPYASIVGDVAKEVGLAPAVIRAVIEQESNYDARAVSAKGAIGLMQLRPETAERFGARDPFDPRENIRAGARYLRWLSGLFGDRLELVLAAYNAGEQAVVRAGHRIPEYAETKHYVARILARLNCDSLAACNRSAARS
jgi:soluble lytic murein transglycosylase-like protein